MWPLRFPGIPSPKSRCPVISPFLLIPRPRHPLSPTSPFYFLLSPFSFLLSPFSFLIFIPFPLSIVIPFGPSSPFDRHPFWTVIPVRPSSRRRPGPNSPRCRNQTQPLPPNHVALQRRFTLSWVPAFAGMTIWKGSGTAGISFFVLRANYFLVLPTSPFPLPIVIPFGPLSPSDRHPFRPSSPLDRHRRSTVIPAQAGTQLAALPQPRATATPQTRRSATPLHPELGPGLRRDDGL